MMQEPVCAKSDKTHSLAIHAHSHGIQERILTLLFVIVVSTRLTVNCINTYLFNRLYEYLTVHYH